MSFRNLKATGLIADSDLFSGMYSLRITGENIGEKM